MSFPQAAPGTDVCGPQRASHAHCQVGIRYLVWVLGQEWNPARNTASNGKQMQTWETCLNSGICHRAPGIDYRESLLISLAWEKAYDFFLLITSSYYRHLILIWFMRRNANYNEKTNPISKIASLVFNDQVPLAFRALHGSTPHRQPHPVSTQAGDTYPFVLQVMNRPIFIC